MFLSNPAKSLLATVLISLTAAGCGWFGTRTDTVARHPEQPKSKIPFKTTEPESFQCELVETAGEIVRRKRLAKKGTFRRVDFDFGEATQRALLQTETRYLLDIGRRIYAEVASSGESEPAFSELTHELLAIGQNAEFEESAREGGIIRYVVRPANGAGSEIIVHYDESIGLPVKQEYFSLTDGVRTLQFTVEMVNLKTEPDAGIFTVPADFRRVSLNELVNAGDK